jgi:acyl-CoA thioester hydrolase
MEEARIDALQRVGIDYADLVAMGCDLPVIELSLNYRKALRMGDMALVQSRMLQLDKVRWIWSQNITLQSAPKTLCVEGRVVLVALDTQNRRVMRSLPPLLRSACDRFLGQIP